MSNPTLNRQIAELLGSSEKPLRAIDISRGVEGAPAVAVVNAALYNGGFAERLPGAGKPLWRLKPRAPSPPSVRALCALEIEGVGTLWVKDHLSDENARALLAGMAAAGARGVAHDTSEEGQRLARLAGGAGLAAAPL